MIKYKQIPFFFLPIKKIRPRTATEKFYNSRKIEKEFNEKYELIQLYKNSFQYIQSSDMDNSHIIPAEVMNIKVKKQSFFKETKFFFVLYLIFKNNKYFI